VRTREKSIDIFLDKIETKKVRSLYRQMDAILRTWETVLCFALQRYLQFRALDMTQNKVNEIIRLLLKTGYLFLAIRQSLIRLFLLASQLKLLHGFLLRLHLKVTKTHREKIIENVLRFEYHWLKIACWKFLAKSTQAKLLVYSLILDKKMLCSCILPLKFTASFN